MNLDSANKAVLVKDAPSSKGQGVFAARFIRQGEIVVVGRRLQFLPERSRYSLQMNVDTHVELDAPAILLNHSCEPNTGVKNNHLGGYNFIALKDISTEEEITFDYETTEYISIAVPKCNCGSKNCRKEIRGFKFLPESIRRQYGEYIADYLKTI
jgi:SET domain-containing protein